MSRAFLERSLADLDREYGAGDLDRADYERLRAEYERRLRGEGPPPRPPARPAFLAAGIAFVLVVAIGAGVLVAQSIGRREEGANITGGGPSADAQAPPAREVPAELARCRALDGGEAIDCYTSYTDDNPDDPDGFVDFGLFAVNAGLANQRTELVEAGEAFLRRALEIDPGHLAGRANLAVLLERTGDAAGAAEQCALLAGVDLPADLQPLFQLACA